MKFHLRVDNANTMYIRPTVFIDGANCGRLTMKVREYERFSRLLLMGGMKWGVGNMIQCDGYVPESKGQNDDKARI